MKLKGSFFVIIMLLAVVANAQVPRVISYQGVLTASPGGSPVNGMRNLGFALYESEDDFATPIWTETHLGVHVQHGVFAVYLGSATPFPSSVDFSKQYWLGISIDGGAELTPRFHLTASPYAMNIPSMGAEDGQVLKWNATSEKWEPDDISTCGLLYDGTCQSWNRDGEVLYTADGGPNECEKAFMGVAKGNAGNTIAGIEKTHVNIGASSVTGLSETDSFCTVSGGKRNEALNDFATIAGGDSNIVHSQYGFIGGGHRNYVTTGADTSVISGGSNNLIGSYCSFIGGGTRNTITPNAQYSVIAGGDSNSIIGGIFTTIGGGGRNEAGTDHATIAGGWDNFVSTGSFVGGGQGNKVYGAWAAIAGGEANIDSSNFCFLGAGKNNRIRLNADYSVICGGDSNIVEDAWSTIGGGYHNLTTHSYATIGGGKNNIADSIYTTVSGGLENLASSPYATVGGGYGNIARYGSVISGGGMNTSGVAAFFSAIGGGFSNEITQAYSTIAGGYENFISGQTASILGGRYNEITGNGTYSAILGGYNNSISGARSAIIGGATNTVSGDYSLAFGRSVSVNNSYVTAFYDGDYPGKLGINEPSPNSTLHYDGSEASAFTSKTSNYTLTVNDHTVFTTNAITITLPDADECGGRIYYIRNTDETYTLKIDGGSTNIERVTDIDIPPDEGVIVQSDGSNWWVIADYTAHY